MREQVAAEQLGQRGGERRLRRDKRSGMGHFPPPFGLSLSKPRSFLPASKKDSPSTSSGRTEFMAVIKLIVRSFQRGGSSAATASRSEEHTSELQSLMRISYAVFCLKKTKNNTHK